MTNTLGRARAHSGAISAAVLSALAGFAAGALLVGAVTSDGRPVVAGEPAVAATGSAGAPHESVPLAAMIEGGRSWPTDPQPLPWSYEAKAPAATDVAGPRRSDRLSGPEGWTYDSSAQTD